MRAYELMIIVDGDLDEPVAQAWTKTVVDQIAAAGGQVHGNADWWGKRRFAYEIKHKSEGYYAVFNLVAEPGALDGFERSLRLADDIVRHKLIRLPDAEAARRGLLEAGTTA
jgi:small subunit ribosomal protein S6